MRPLYRKLFETEYATLFGRSVAGLDVEITVWSVNATTLAQQSSVLPPLVDVTEPAQAQFRTVFDPALATEVRAAVVQRETLEAGHRVAGPAAIIEDETTIIVPSSRTALKQPDGCIDLQTVDHAVGSAAAVRTDAASAVANQVMWNRLISVVEEQAQALVRTAFSTSVREAGDLSAGVYDTQGQMLAQAVTGTPGHVNAMADSVGHFMRRIGVHNMHEGDVYITNDPWEGTGHLHDITVVTPTFYQQRLVGFFACTAHIVDIGGRGFGADANSIFEEGLQIPIMKFADRGEVDQTLLAIIRGNVREPDQLVGDVFALATCNEIGQRRLHDMLQEFALNGLDDIARFILDNSRSATVAEIARLDGGRASGALSIDGYSHPVELKVALEIKSDHILCDFAGSSGLDKKGINVPLVYTRAYACYALKCAIAPHIPNNAASLAPFVITAPEHSIVNAVHPAPVALRHVIGHMGARYGLQRTGPTAAGNGAGRRCGHLVQLPGFDQPAQ